MKKLTALLLAVIMVFSLTACGARKSEAVKNTESLIKAIGTVTADSGEAIAAAEAAYDALTEEEKTTVSGYDTLVKAREDYGKKMIVGQWVSVVNITDEKPATVTFNDDGTFTSSAGMSGPYTFKGDGILLGLEDSGLSQENTIETRHGITHIITTTGADYVKTEDATYSEVAITMDNWQDYFEVKEFFHVTRNGFGEAERAYHSFQLEVKEEYKNRIVKTNYSQNATPKAVTAETKFTEIHKFVSINDDNTYTILGAVPYWSDDTDTEIVDIIGYEFAYNEYDDGWCFMRDLANQNGHVSKYEGRFEAALIQNPVITRIGGTLLLYDNPIHK